MDQPKGLKVLDACRICHRPNPEPVLSLGVQYITNFIDSPNQEVYVAPLELVLCDKNKGGCGLLQLKHSVPQELLYRKFWYKSGVNQTMINELASITKAAEYLIEFKDGDIVVDIGANDGTLLRSFGIKNLRLVGFEPAVNLIDEAKVGTTIIFNDFFSSTQFEDYFGDQKAKLVTSIAMFYDLENPNEFVRDIVKILDHNGIWIIQMNYLATMMENNAFDNISHEHLEYYSLASLEYLLKKYGLEVFDVELNNVNGGSIRTYIKRKSCSKYVTTRRVDEIRRLERNIQLNSYDTYSRFADRIKHLKHKTHSFITDQVEKGRKIYVYGASTRGNVLLQFYKLDNKLITAAADRNPMKWGKEIVGTGIPIISEEQARRERPDYFLVLPWYFFEEFRIREAEYLRKGGKFILPLPDFRVVSSNNP